MAGPRNIFCLLFLIVFCTGTVLGEDKQGLCPPQRCATCKPNTVCVNWCTTDDDCSWNKKCCPEAGVKVCKPPKRARPGRCPKGPITRPNCDDECTSDSECAIGFKCCFSAGLLKCVPPIGEPDGFCPPPLYSNPPFNFVPCETCPMGQICCLWDHRYKCMFPVPDKPGSCRRNTIYCKRGNQVLCTSDKACPDEEKCCGRDCGKECTSDIIIRLPDPTLPNESRRRH